MEYNDEGLELLRVEIVASVVRDLKTAMAESDRRGHTTNRQISLENWLLSTWGQMLSGGNGEDIIDRCRRTYRVEKHKNGVAKISEQTKETMLKEWEKGMSQRDVAKKYGVSQSWFHKLIRERK